jgi:hypothetical protein
MYSAHTRFVAGTICVSPPPEKRGSGWKVQGGLSTLRRAAVDAARPALAELLVEIQTHQSLRGLGR